MHNATYTFSSPVFDTKSLSINVKAMNKNLYENVLQFVELYLFLLNSQAIVFFNIAPLSYILSPFAA